MPGISVTVLEILALADRCHKRQKPANAANTNAENSEI